MSPRRPGVRALVLSACILLSAAAPAGAQGGPGVFRIDVVLPTARSAMASVWDGRDRPEAGCPGGCAYLFGGSPGVGREILRVNPSSDTVMLMRSTLPSDRDLMAVVWSGTRAYLFGGRPVTDQVLEYDPDDDELTLFPARLPAPDFGMSAVWTGDAAYIFGGSFLNEPAILRFDPVAQTVQRMSSDLPENRIGAATVWDGTYVYVVGGWARTESRNQVVYRYDPGRDQLFATSARMPAAQAYMAAATDGSSLYLLGGQGGVAPDRQASSQVLRFDPRNLGFEEVPVLLPSPRMEATAVWAGDRMLVFGGSDGQQPLDTSLEFFPRVPAAEPSGDGPVARWDLPGWPTLVGGLFVIAGLAAGIGIVLSARSRRAGAAAIGAQAPRPAATALAATPPAAARGKPLLRLEGIQVKHQGQPVLHPVSFDLPAGTLALLLGPSGAGKSSLLRALAGVVPCQGSIEVRGRRVRPGDAFAKASLGYVPQDLQLHTNLDAMENLAYFAAQFGISAREARQRGRLIMQDLGLDGLHDRALDQLSGGQQRRVSIAVALAHQPSLLVLDEPTSGLDLGARKALWMVVQRLAHERGVGVLASSHFIDDAAYADLVGILANGTLVALGSPRELIRSLPGQGKCVEVELEGLDAAGRDRLKAALQQARTQGLLERADLGMFSVRCFAKDPRTAARLLPGLLERASLRVRAIRLDDIRMEDVFVHLTGRAAPA